MISYLPRGVADDEFIFIIDTNKYAGNFERQLVAFCTSRTGVCGVGKKESERFFSDTGLHFDSEPFHYVKQTSDLYGNMRPVYICQTPNYFYVKGSDTIEIFFSETPPLRMRKETLTALWQCLCAKNQHKMTLI